MFTFTTTFFLLNRGEGVKQSWKCADVRYKWPLSVLENHHAAFGFKVTMSDERVNIFQNLDRDSFKLIRQGIIDLVLATDMSKHFVHLNKFVSVFTNSIVSVCCYFTNDLNETGFSYSYMVL